MLQNALMSSRDVESALRTMEHSSLRRSRWCRLSGWAQWRHSAGKAAPRLMAVNIGRRGPRPQGPHHLERNSHQFLEGADRGLGPSALEVIYIYLRDEYHGYTGCLTRGCRRLRTSPPDPPLRGHRAARGAGAYICGEESADGLVESKAERGVSPRHCAPPLRRAKSGLFRDATGAGSTQLQDAVTSRCRKFLARGADCVHHAWSEAAHGRKGCAGTGKPGARLGVAGLSSLAPAGIARIGRIDEHCGARMADSHALRASSARWRVRRYPAGLRPMFRSTSIPCNRTLAASIGNGNGDRAGVAAEIEWPRCSA